MSKTKTESLFRLKDHHGLISLITAQCRAVCNTLFTPGRSQTGKRAHSMEQCCQKQECKKEWKEKKNSLQVGKEIRAGERRKSGRTVTVYAGFSAPACERGCGQDLLQPLLRNHSLKASLSTYLTLTHTHTHIFVLTSLHIALAIIAATN